RACCPTRACGVRRHPPAGWVPLPENPIGAPAASAHALHWPPGGGGSAPTAPHAGGCAPRDRHRPRRYGKDPSRSSGGSRARRSIRGRGLLCGSRHDPRARVRSRRAGARRRRAGSERSPARRGGRGAPARPDDPGAPRQLREGHGRGVPGGGARSGLPPALLERLGSRLKLLRGGARDLPVRHQTLRDTIDWSYEALDAREQRLFALLSVFSGCTLEAVERVAAGIERPEEPGVDILDGLGSLVDKSLVRRVDQRRGESRFVMLETIREYAGERREEDAQWDAAARSAHAAYFADFTEHRWERLTGEGREAALEEMEADIENVRAAWRHFVT